MKQKNIARVLALLLALVMITGPATKITNLGALKIVLGIKHFAMYFAFVMLYALVSGFIVNLIA